MYRVIKLFIVLSVMFGFCTGAYAATVNTLVKNDKGKPVEDAVVYVVVKSKAVRKAAKRGVIDQVDKEFVDYVTVVKVGTPVFFPNHDQIRHHVYSFSKPKTFEIPLYLGTPAKPVIFNKQGVVVLGCNIHDWMSAYIFITDTSYFGVTDKQGNASIKKLPAGKYDVKVWHPQLRGKPDATAQRVSLSASSRKNININIKQRRLWSVRRAPTMVGGAYR